MKLEFTEKDGTLTITVSDVTGLKILTKESVPVLKPCVNKLESATDVDTVDTKSIKPREIKADIKPAPKKHVKKISKTQKRKMDKLHAAIAKTIDNIFAKTDLMTLNELFTKLNETYTRPDIHSYFGLADCVIRRIIQHKGVDRDMAMGTLEQVLLKLGEDHAWHIAEFMMVPFVFGVDSFLERLYRNNMIVPLSALVKVVKSPHFGKHFGLDRNAGNTVRHRGKFSKNCWKRFTDKYLLAATVIENDYR